VVSCRRLANLFLHYAFDLWVTRHLPGVRFARYADDAVLHGKSKRQAEYVLHRIRERFRACKLELHPGKTRIVYCKDINRAGDHPDIQFTFLGYTFRPRKALDKYGRVYVNFSPAVSREALKDMRQTIRGWHLQLKSEKTWPIYRPCSPRSSRAGSNIMATSADRRSNRCGGT
jgi:RNA-directed DNA polymerase